jgi:hypothetical protein
MKKPLIKYCGSCGEGFVAKRANAIYCSKDCRGRTHEYGASYKSLQKRFLPSCLTCGNAIDRKDNWDRDFCNKECRMKWKKRVIITNNCLYCQKEFISSKPTKKFCQDNCRKSYSAEKNSIERDTLKAINNDLLAHNYRTQVDYLKKFIDSFYRAEIPSIIKDKF